MAPRKRKTLPKDFKEMLSSAPLDELIAVFDRCEVEATGGYTKHTALGFVECPDELVEWLVAHGADVNAENTYRATALHQRANVGWHQQIPLLVRLGADVDHPDYQLHTPLRTAAGRHQPAAVAALLDAGANVHAEDNRGFTPLAWALLSTRNAMIPGMVEVARLLLAAGARVTDEARAEVERIGTEFEFHRGSFNADLLGETDAPLGELYALFAVDAAPARVVHDGAAPIVVPPGPWQDRFQALWELLVPSSGAAATVQGEAIRIAGRVHREIFDNGGANWDRDFRAMLDALGEHLAGGTPLPPDRLAEATRLIERFRGGDGDGEELDRLVELTVDWVSLNPAPRPLQGTAYGR